MGAESRAHANDLQRELFALRAAIGYHQAVLSERRAMQRSAGA